MNKADTRLGTTSSQPRARKPGSSRSRVQSRAPQALQVPAQVRLIAEHATNSAPHCVTFEYWNPFARDVFVAGNFNGWAPAATPLKKDRDGKWTADVLLDPGRYEYRLIVDGAWQNDPMAAQFVANPFGGLNCVRVVEP